MPLEIANWNLSPNREWFVRLAWSDPVISVELYLTQADADGQANRQAAGSGSAGNDVPVTLAADPGALEISFYQQTEPWHLKVSGQAGDPVRVFHVKEFVDLADITHPAYRNADLVRARAAAEINAHTMANLSRTIAIAGHYPDLEPGDIVALNSTRRGIDQKCQVTGFTISGDPDSLLSTIECSRFVAVTR